MKSASSAPAGTGIVGSGPHISDTNSYFLKEALKWMEGASKDVEGKLYCPSDKCKARVGSLNWVGVETPAGWVSPAIQVSAKAVDERVMLLAPPAPPPPPPPLPEPEAKKKKKKKKTKKVKTADGAAAGGEAEKRKKAKKSKDKTGAPVD